MNLILYKETEMKKTILIIFIFLVIGCAPQKPLIKATQSGYPEGIFQDTTTEEVKNKIIECCVSKGLMVLESSSNQIFCGKTMQGQEAVFAQMLIGNSYSTTPEKKIRFIIYEIGNNVKVTAQEWIETQMAFGQVKRQELNSNNQKNDIQNFLFSIGAY